VLGGTVVGAVVVVDCPGVSTRLWRLWGPHSTRLVPPSAEPPLAVPSTTSMTASSALPRRRRRRSQRRKVVVSMRFRVLSSPPAHGSKFGSSAVTGL
jgi:hypothetical protein